MASTPRGSVARGLPPTPQGSSPRSRRFSMESGTRLNGGRNSGRRNSVAHGAPAVIPTVGAKGPDKRLSLDEQLTAASAAASLSHRRASTYRAGSEAGRITGPRGSSAWGAVHAWHGGNGLGTALARAQAALGADAALAPTSPREVRSRRSMCDMEDSGVRQRATAELSIGARDTTHCHLSHVVAAYQAAEVRRQARRQRDAAAAAAAARRSSIRWGGAELAPSNAKQSETAADAAHCETVGDVTVPARRMSYLIPPHAKLDPMPDAPLCVRCRCDLVRVCVCCFT